MPDIITLHDLADRNDPQGRTIKEVNLSKPHKFKVGQLVEIDNGVRLLVSAHGRDCDGSPLYDLTAEMLEADERSTDYMHFAERHWKRLLRNWGESWLKSC